MRRILLAVAVALLALPPMAEAAGSGVELTLFGGYRSGGDFESIGNFDLFDPELEVDDGDVLGAALGIPLGNHLIIEVSYSRQDSELFIDEGLFEPREKLSDLDVTYAMASLQYQWTPGQLRPYFGGGLGIAFLDPTSGGLQDEEAFAVTINGGLKVLVTDHFGFRLDGRIYAADLDTFEGDRCRRCDDFEDDDLVQSEATVGIFFKF